MEGLKTASVLKEALPRIILEDALLGSEPGISSLAAPLISAALKAQVSYQLSSFAFVFR
jgi:hypothetical protein